MSQTYKFGRGTWANKEGSTLAYNDEGNNYKPLPFSFERDSIATRVNKEGLIEVVGKDIPRIDYTDSSEGVLLLENSATNLITYSEDFSHSSWAKTSVSITSNSILSPDGSLNASTITEDSSLNNHRISVNGLVGSGTHTISVFAKANDRNWLIIRNAANNAWFDISNGVVGTVQSGTGSIEAYENGWYKCSLTMSSLSTPAVGIADNNGSYSYQGNGTGSLYIWGAVAESNSVATSYIPTSGSTVQRAAETANGSGNSEVFNDSEGVLFADISALVDDGVNKFISISDGTINNRINIVFDTSNNINGRQAPGSVNISTSGVNILNSNKIAYEYQSNSQELWVNGFKIGETSVSSLPSGLDRLNFDSFNGGDDMYAKTKEIAYYDAILTDLELETLTSYRSLNELVTELNLNTL